MNNILEVNGLVKRYPAFSLDNISFSLPEGCVTGFIGANGAGKTTTIRSILKLAHKDAGTIKIFGLDTVKHEQEIKDRIGIVMDGSYFYNELSMQDMKSIVAPAYSKWSDADYRSYMEKFELDPKQKISTLSKGMRMKFALVLALSHQAEHCGECKCTRQKSLGIFHSKPPEIIMSIQFFLINHLFIITTFRKFVNTAFV